MYDLKHWSDQIYYCYDYAILSHDPLICIDFAFGFKNSLHYLNKSDVPDQKEIREQSVSTL